MPQNADTNQIAFDKLKALVAADQTLSDAIKAALTQDCAANPPTPGELKKLFSATDAAPK